MYTSISLSLYIYIYICIWTFLFVQFPAKTSSNMFLWFHLSFFNGFRVVAAPPVSNRWKLMQTPGRFQDAPRPSATRPPSSPTCPCSTGTWTRRSSAVRPSIYLSLSLSIYIYRISIYLYLSLSLSLSLTKSLLLLRLLDSKLPGDSLRAREFPTLNIMILQTHLSIYLSS